MHFKYLSNSNLQLEPRGKTKLPCQIGSVGKCEKIYAARLFFEIGIWVDIRPQKTSFISNQNSERNNEKWVYHFYKITNYFGWHLLLETAVAGCLMLLWCYSQFMHRISSEHLQKAPFKKRRPESLLQHSQLPTLPFCFAILLIQCIYLSKLLLLVWKCSGGFEK